MSSKRALKPYALKNPADGSNTFSLAASFNAPATVITYEDNIAYQIIVTTGDSVGTFAIQVSMDYVPAADPMAAPSVAGTWTTLTLSGSPAVAAANDSIVISLNQVPYNAIRLTYTSSVAGTGTCKIIIETKGLS